LRHHGVELLVDVRTVPASRRMPQFNKAALEHSLPARGIAYRHLPDLGGLRKPRADSINTGWRNVSFRGYADYMQTQEFWRGIDELIDLTPVTAVMCAEAVPWKCHRSLVADALTARGVDVRHVTSGAEPARHKITPFARVENGRITYPAPDTLPI
jgi:uncharacterized protein (DUF488 family)